MLWVKYADNNNWFVVSKKITPLWHGWLNNQYDDPPIVRFHQIKLFDRKRTSWSPFTGNIKFWPSKQTIHMLNRALATC